MKTIVYVPDIECDSCTRVLSKRIAPLGLPSFTFTREGIDADVSEQSQADALVKTVKEAGFRASFQPFERKSFSERWKDFRENPDKYELERKGIGYAIGVFVILSLLEYVAYIGFLQNIPDFLSTYGIWLLYINLSVSALGLGIWHVFAYEAKVTCMVGMMIGMTIGMQSGLMIGAIIGATNGFFIGALTGMLLGVGVGIFTGRCCGIMGVMEGMMAGVMGGTMGPMITVMMFTDHIHWFMPFYMIINLIIILGLSYMLFEEVVEHREVATKPLDFTTFASACVAATFVLVVIMIYAPKSLLFA